MSKNRKKNMVMESTAEVKLKGFLDMIAPSVIRFHTDHYICGNTYRSVWVLREYLTAFRCSSKLSQHISFLKDFFGTYKNFTDSQIDTIEIMLGKLYKKWNIRDDMEISKLAHRLSYPFRPL